MDKKAIISLGNDLRNQDEEAFSKLMNLIESRNPDAMIELGKFSVENGQIEAGTNLYVLAMNHGSSEAIDILGVNYFENNPLALTNLGKLYSQGGVTVERDHSKAVSLYRQAAELGENEAMYCLGKCYYNGVGVVKSIDKEVEWYIKAAEANNLEACLNLGKLYKYGWGVEKSRNESKKWYMRAVAYYEVEAKAGSIYAINQIAGIYSNYLKEYEAAISWYKKAARLGDNNAVYQIAELYDENIKDSEKVIEWYKKSADLGNGNAAFRISQIYGEEMNDDVNEIKWLNKAYQLGSVDGLYFLGSLYKEKHDFDKAKEYFGKLAEVDGHEGEGRRELGRLYEELGEYDKAKEYYEKLSEAGAHEGMSGLGAIYANGRGVQVDIDQAVKWYEEAYEAGDYSAIYKIKELEIINYITKNPGTLQKDIYKEFHPDHKDRIMSALKTFDEDNRIIRVKHGSTYKLFIE